MKNNQRKVFNIVSITVFFLIFLHFFSSMTFWRDPFILLGETFGLGGYIFFSISLFLGSRWKKLEDWIGGLDQIYHLHHQLGMIGFTLLILHPLLIATKWLPHRLDKFLSFLLPIHHRLAINLGSFAFWIMIIVIGITLLHLLPYSQWKVLHRFMSLAYILGALHFVLGPPFYFITLTDALFYPFFIVGLFGVIYKQIYLPYAKKTEYTVTDTQKITDNIVEIKVEPTDKPLQYIPGQYAFFTFYSPKISDEAHPFTMCPYEKGFSILVKVRGDFTKILYSEISPGWKLELEGPYGRFNYKKAGKNQIWIGGGIGVVPFLTWARELSSKKESEKNIAFFLCVHRKKDKAIFEEFKKIGHRVSHFHPFLFCSEDRDRLNMEKLIDLCGSVKKRDILMCGPRRLTRDFTKKFLSLGVERKNIFYEDFEFF